MDLFDSLDQNRRAQDAPLAERMRPQRLEDLFGLDDIVGQDAVLRRLFSKRRLLSLVLWGPPGSGKTTLARVLAQRSDFAFESLSAVMSGVKDLREVVKRAKERSRMEARGTVLFIDEIHRFNKSQQDALLPHIEDGTLVFIGATTENPAFELNRPLLSRCRLVTLPSLSDQALRAIIESALEDPERGLGGWRLQLEAEALDELIRLSVGDARTALNLLEACAHAAPDDSDPIGLIDRELVLAVVQKPGAIIYDKSGDSHFQAISALHKSLRGSDPDAALYWLVRMLEGGEDPLYIARRMVRFASEDIGLADPDALTRALSGMEAARFLGRPEGDLALAQVAIDLALAPKSNAIEKAYLRCLEEVRQSRPWPVPLHLRNIKVGVSPEERQKSRYLYPHDYQQAVVPQAYFPKDFESEARPYYRPSEFGQEQRQRARLKELAEQLDRAREAGREQWALPEDELC